MKKLICAAFAIVFSVTVFAVTTFAQELKISGEAKTGIDWREERYAGKEPESLDDPVRMYNRDDAGSNQGRFRVNLDFEGDKFLGFRARLDWENWSYDSSNPGNVQPKWKYAFGYGNFFENQMTVAIGKLGGSPWSTGGPEMWKELEQNNSGGGMRVEWKPSFMPEKGWGKLNVGFVLNWMNSYTDDGSSRTANLLELLQETVLGVSYTHDWFMVRFAYRLDSELDRRERGSFIYGREGDDLIYRVEEYALRRLLPGMQIWALGWLEGVFADDPYFYRFQNWGFIQYEPPELGSLTTPFTAQIRLGYDTVEKRSEFLVKPSFYWHFNIGEHPKLISAGAAFSYRQDYGTKIWAGSPYSQMEIEPKVQLNFTSSFIAFVYSWKIEYMGSRWPELPAGENPTKQTQFFNLRFCIYY
jgi:hypothetical protein